jgi:hypothetical protein
MIVAIDYSLRGFQNPVNDTIASPIDKDVNFRGPRLDPRKIASQDSAG